MKRYSSFGLFCILCASLILFSCKKEIPVTSITLDQTELLLDEGKTASLTATVEPSDVFCDGRRYRQCQWYLGHHQGRQGRYCDGIRDLRREKRFLRSDGRAGRNG